MTHAFLSDPENLRAFQQLTAAPTGSVRKWERLLGWRPGRMQRFLNNLIEYGLAEVTSCKQFSAFKPLVGVADCSGVMCSVAAPNQAASGLTTKPRFGGSPVELQEGGEDLIALMNGILCRNHPLDYLPVQLNNWGSHKAARIWLVELNIPMKDALEILTQRCATFNPSKINGDMPRSLGFFTKSMRAEWQRRQRDRQQLGLFPKMEMKVERVASPYNPEPEPPPPTPEQIAALRAEFERVAADPDAKRTA